MLNLKNLIGTDKINNPELVYICDLLNIEHKTNIETLNEKEFLRPEYKCQSKMKWHDDHIEIIDTKEIIEIKTIRTHANTFLDPDDGWTTNYNCKYEIKERLYSRNRAKQLYFDYEYMRKDLLVFNKLHIDQILERFWSIIKERKRLRAI